MSPASVTKNDSTLFAFVRSLETDLLLFQGNLSDLIYPTASLISQWWSRTPRIHGKIVQMLFLSSLLIFHVWYDLPSCRLRNDSFFFSQITVIKNHPPLIRFSAMQWMSRIQRWNLFAKIFTTLLLWSTLHEGRIIGFRFSKCFTSAGSDLEQTIGSSCPVQPSIQRQIDRFDHSILRFNSM